MIMGTELFLVGAMDQEGDRWDFVGIFYSKVQAERECCDKFHFIKPVKLSEPIEPGTWEGVYFQREAGAA